MSKNSYVEDEPFLGKIVKETLENQGFEILLINDGALVINVFNKFIPDICVLDVMLPMMALALGDKLASSANIFLPIPASNYLL